MGDAEFGALLEPHLREYMHESYGDSLGVARALYKDTEDAMASAYYAGDDDYYQREMMKQTNKRIDQLEKENLEARTQQMAQQSHTHQLGAQAFGSIGAVGGLQGFSAGTDASLTATSTGDWSTNTIAVDSTGSLQLDESQLDEAVKRYHEPGRPGSMKKPKRTNRLTKWFRLNEEFPSDYGNKPSDVEPLDDLRQEMAAWLEDV